MVHERAFEIGDAVVARVLLELEERREAAVGLHVLDALRDDGVPFEGDRPARDAGLALFDADAFELAVGRAVAVDVGGIGALLLATHRVRVARVHGRADREAAFDPELPGGLRSVARLVEDVDVEAGREELEPAAIGGLEGQPEERLARRALQHHVLAPLRAVEIVELLGVVEDDGQANVDGEILVQADVDARLEARDRLLVLRDVHEPRRVPARGQAGLVDRGLAQDLGALALVAEAERHVEVERIAVVEGVDDVRHLAGLHHDARLRRAVRLLCGGRGGEQRHRRRAERGCDAEASQPTEVEIL